MGNRRDWELVPISKALGMQFGYDIFPTEYQKIAGDLSLVRLSDPEFLKIKASGDRLAPIIKKGAAIDEKIMKIFLTKNCSVLPVLIKEPKPLNVLSSFAQKQTFMLSGRVFSCVDDWLDRLRKDRSVGVLQAVKRYRTPLLQSLNNALKDWEAVTITLINDILVADENLSVLSIFDEFISNPKKQNVQKEHSIEVAVLALMIARKCKLPIHDLKALGMAAMIHDLGMLVYEQKLNELMHIGGQILEPDIIRDYYNRHSIYGAILLSKKNGETITGITPAVRSIVLEHEQKIDGTGPKIKDPEFSEELDKMGIPKEIIYLGDNKINLYQSHPKEIHFPGLPLVKQYMNITSQILHISEFYVTTLDRFKRRKVVDPHKETLKVMLKQAGSKINGQVFEVFFNHLIPPDYYPENLVVKIDSRTPGIDKKYVAYHNYSAVILSVKDAEEKPRKMMRIIKKPDGREVSQNILFDLITEKKSLYLKIDDWSKYATPR